jgi:midasin
VRRDGEKEVVQACIEKHLKVKIDTEGLYSCTSMELFQKYMQDSEGAGEDPTHPLYPFARIVWTRGMKRLFAIAVRCIEVAEPILLVGETGSGKTTVCQLIAALRGQALHIANCHQNTETADLIGGLRPNRQTETADVDVDMSDTDGAAAETAGGTGQLFRWYDGPLVIAMRKGDMMLIDEISLAEDSVLERLNSVLEPSRTIFLAEKGGDNADQVVAHPEFRILATMNPGGDFGKRELSPALRNRFTEVWVPSVTDRDDLINVMTQLLADSHAAAAVPSVEFSQWLLASQQSTAAVSLRDYVAWAEFVNQMSPTLGLWGAWVHGASLVFLDALGTGSSRGAERQRELQSKCLDWLFDAMPEDVAASVRVSLQPGIVTSFDTAWGMGPFTVARGPCESVDGGFTLSAPTSASNAFRVLRAMQLDKPILLEGSPGVGKTSLVMAIARAAVRAHSPFWL